MTISSVPGIFRGRKGKELKRLQGVPLKYCILAFNIKTLEPAANGIK